MEKAKEKNVKIHLPFDFLTAHIFAENAKTELTDINKGI